MFVYYISEECVSECLSLFLSHLIIHQPASSIRDTVCQSSLWALWVSVCVCVSVMVCGVLFKSLAMSPVKTLGKHTQKLICRGRSTTKRQDKQGVKQKKTLCSTTVRCVCVNPLCLCGSSVFWPYLGSFTVNR